MMSHKTFVRVSQAKQPLQAFQPPVTYMSPVIAVWIFILPSRSLMRLWFFAGHHQDQTKYHTAPVQPGRVCMEKNVSISSTYPGRMPLFPKNERQAA